MKKYLSGLFASAGKKLPYLNGIEINIDVPKIESHGDLSVNVAMLLTKVLKKNPREIALEIIESFEIDEDIIEKVEVAGPGFINFTFTSQFVSKIISEIINKVDRFGQSDKYSGKRAIVEFVSANPTGPLTVGHGRNAVIGDTVSNMLEWIGYEVDREFYFNDAGRQMRMLGDSVKQRYLQAVGDEIEFPEDYYQGQYIVEIAQCLKDEFGDSLREEDPEGEFKAKAQDVIFTDIKQTLNNIKINMKNFYNEKSLYDDGRIDDVIAKLKEKKLAYESEGATWFKLTELGMDQDKVIIKSSGEPTYRLPDIAYHITKYERGYDLLVDVFGSDHHATYPDVLAGLQALGFDKERVKVLLYQFVTILKDGEVVKMSTRKANYITMDELVDEVGSDVVRYFFIMRNMSSHLNFDIDLAKKQSDENPVFYLQYAHARICSMLNLTKDESMEYSLDHLELLVAPSEKNLCKKLHKFEEEVLFSAENFEPHRIANYLEEIAALFHRFYAECRIIGTEKSLAEARIALVIATRIVIKNGLSILGLSAPERM
ncbi:MAG: arginine--tRNA ligase [Bacteroidetes bacterium]|nr:arginine--tRNA ligase [Bacteroidota bacterium]